MDSWCAKEKPAGSPPSVLRDSSFLPWPFTDCARQGQIRDSAKTEAAQTSAGICRHQAPSKAARPEGQHTGDPPGSGGSRRFCRNQRQQTTIPCSRGIHPLRETDRVSVFRRPGLCAVTRREKISHTICIPAEYQITDERNIRFLRTSAAGSHLPAPCRIRRCGEGSLRNVNRQSGDGNTALHQKCLTVVFSIHLSAVGRRG